MSEPLVIGIESSCDETGVAIVRGTELLANEVASSVEQHVRFGPRCGAPPRRRGWIWPTSTASPSPLAPA